MSLPKEESTPKENGQKCIDRFEKHHAIIDDVIVKIVTELNTRPLVLLPVKYRGAGNGFLLAFSMSDTESKYCPIAILADTQKLKDLVQTVEQEGDYTLVPQSEIPGFKEFSEGKVWAQ